MEKNSWTTKEGKLFYTDLGKDIELKFHTTKDTKIDLEKCPDRWVNKNTMPIERLTNNQVMRVLRNALAHGNLWTNPYPNEIEYIWFSSKKYETINEKPVHSGWQAIRLFRNDLKKLVINWFKFIKQEYAGNDAE